MRFLHWNAEETRIVALRRSCKREWIVWERKKHLRVSEGVAEVVRRQMVKEGVRKTSGSPGKGKVRDFRQKSTDK